MRSERAAAARHSQSAARPPGENNRARGGLRAGRDRSGAERGATPRPQAAGGGSQQPLCPGAPAAAPGGGSAFPSPLGCFSS